MCPPSGGWSTSLHAQQEYRYRGSGEPTGADPALGSEDDHDARIFLAGDATMPGGAISMGGSAAIWGDLDGALPDGRTSSVASIYDRDGKALWYDV